MLRIRGLHLELGDFALRDVTFDVADGDYFVLLGASGTGKTVLLETVAGLMTADAGRVFWDDEDITDARIQQRGLGLVYQDQALFPHLTVYQNIAYGLRWRSPRRSAVRERVQALAADVGVGELLDRYPGTLSGGQAQRVALARALATEPRCLLLDEPISSLDRRARGEVRTLLRRLHRQGHTVLHVTHDYEEAVSLATQVGVMENGLIAQVGTPQDVFHHPRSEFVAGFVGIRNFFGGRLEAGDNGLSQFITGGLAFLVAGEGRSGPGNVILRSEDIVLAPARTETSAQNNFLGIITDVAPARRGVEVTIDIGVELAVLVTERSVARLHLECGRKVWASFKATAAQFIEA